MATTAPLEKPLVWCYEFERDVPYNGLSEEAEAMLREHFDLITVSQLALAPEKMKDIQGMAVFGTGTAYAPFNKVKQMPALRIVANWGAGVNHIQKHFSTLKALGVKMSYTPYAVTDGTADMAMALLLSSARNIVSGHSEATGPEHCKIRVNIHGEEVTGATIGIVGMGRIGMQVAKRARGFDMKVLYHNRTRRSVEDESLVQATYCAILGEMLPQCDFVVVACPLTSDTKHLINDKELRLMKKSGTLVNVARGAVVNTEALVSALSERRIRAAALDVTDPEPLPEVHPLLELDNVIIQPHRGSASNKTRRKMWQTVIDALKAVLIDNAEIPDYARYDL